jgi:transcriptional/translational regulatory protein YebC/TACO1
MPKTTIESAIARGQGISSSGATLEPLTIEAILPPSVAVVIECQTDQKARALQDIRYIIKDSGGIITPTTYLFEKKGRIVLEKTDGLSAEDYLERAIDAGAIDVETDNKGRLTVYVDHTQTKAVGDKLCGATGLRIESSEIIWDPNKDTMVAVRSEEDAQALERLINAIREDPSVQEIYLNSA